MFSLLPARSTDYAHPLLGSRLREQLALLGAQAELKVADARRALARMEVLRILRQRFIAYWRHQRRIVLSRAFSGHERDVGDVLFKRQQKGLVLEADRLEFMTAFAAARREEAKSQAARRHARATLELLTNQRLAEFVADYPVMAHPCLEEGALRLKLWESNPELAALRHILEAKGHPLNFNHLAGIESGVNLGESFLHDFSGGDTGHATVLNVDLRMPLDFLGASRSARDQAAATLSKARLELELRMRELEGEALRLVDSYAASQEDLRFAQLRLAAADEAVRERSLRAQSLPGDVQEQLQRARYGYYQVAMDTVDAEAELLDQQAQLLFFSAQPCVLEPRAGPGQPGPGRFTARPPDRVSPNATKIQGPEHSPPTEQARLAPDPIIERRNAAGFGVYVWESGNLLAGARAWMPMLNAFVERRVSRILASFTGPQIQALKGARRRSLVEFARAADEQGIGVHLLLGEPTWILPGHREKLVTLVKRLRALPFSGLHLDLEPNQLEEEKLGTGYLLQELLKTLSVALDASPWPVALSVHPRYMLRRLGHSSFGARLAALGLDEVSLMVYVTNPQRVYEIAAPIIERHKRLRFSIAQSVESMLPREESYAHLSLKDFQRRMAELHERFKQPNFEGVLIQAWSPYQRMRR